MGSLLKGRISLAISQGNPAQLQSDASNGSVDWPMRWLEAYADGGSMPSLSRCPTISASSANGATRETRGKKSVSWNSARIGLSRGGL